MVQNVLDSNFFDISIFDWVKYLAENIVNKSNVLMKKTYG